MSVAVGDEGGFAPNVPNHEAAIQMILEAISAAGYTPGEHVALGLDCAASEFYKDGQYVLEGEGGLKLSAAQWTDMLATWVDKYPIISIEDGMAEGDWDGWKHLFDRLGSKVQLVGDDIFVTNTRILKEGIDRHRGGHQRRPDQDRLAQPLGPHGQVQPAAAHRRRPG